MYLAIRSTICRHPVSTACESTYRYRKLIFALANPMMLHRSDFLRAMQKEVPAPPQCTIHTSKRLVLLTQNDSDGTVVLHFSDGSTSKADVVVGADGIRSVVRASMLSEDEHLEPEWPGVIAYRAMVPSSALEAQGIGEDHPMRNFAHIVRSLKF